MQDHAECPQRFCMALRAPSQKDDLLETLLCDLDQALNLIIATALKRLSAVAFVIIGIVKDPVLTSSQDPASLAV